MSGEHNLNIPQDNANIWLDQKSVNYATLALLSVAILQTVFGILALGQVLSFFSETTSKWVGRVSLLGALVLFATAVGTYLNRSEFAKVGTAVAGINVLVSLMSLKPILIVLSLVFFFFILHGYITLRRIDTRVQATQQENPLVEYYHRLIPVLVRVMAADGHIDRRERKKVYELCDSMKLSRYEQQALVRNALKYKDTDLQTLVDNYLEVAQRVKLRSPQRKLMSAAFAVASADGIFVNEEIALLRQIGRGLGVRAGTVDAMVRQQKSHLENIDLSTAHEILGVEEGANEEQIRNAYMAFMQDFETEQYANVGERLQQHILQRKGAVEKAFQVLQTA